MRPVTIGTAAMIHPSLSEDEKRFDSPDPLFEEAEPHIVRAGELGCDFLCLPELFPHLRRSQPIEETAEPPDGPSARYLADAAKRHSVALVTSILLEQNGKISNTGVIYTKTGQCLGQYPKVHLPIGEREHCQAGEDFPVFEIDAVTVGMQICYDFSFPEGCRAVALNGADIIFWPNMWGGMPEQYTDVIMRARAIENLVWVVSSGYYLGGPDSLGFREPKIFGRSCIVSWDGTILAEVGRRTGTVAATIDLDEPRYSSSTRQNMLFDHRMPETYSRLVQGNTE